MGRTEAPKPNTENHSYCIISGEITDAKLEYAVKELQRYIYALTGEFPARAEQEDTGAQLTFVLGTPATNPLIKALGLPLSSLCEEGYLLRTTEQNRRVIIASNYAQGVLYGVYGLLEDYYQVGFYLSGDVLSQERAPLKRMRIEEIKNPEQRIRGILPWTNFPQSATSYSLRDWIFIIDQMTRMRMNFINIHNYNGEFGHNEMFHNLMLNNTISRNWNATASKAHAWFTSDWDVNEYLFGGAELFDDYDFGADAALHNDFMENLGVFKKGSSQFQFLLHYAHQRGVKIGLGLDLNLIMPDYEAAADDEAVVRARANQIVVDYPALDYLMLYRSENFPDFKVWDKAFQILYAILQEKAPAIQVAVSGWGLDPDTIVSLPKEVIAAPISGHGVNDQFPNGDIYGDREFWACPWSERDYDDSVYFAPYQTKLSTTIHSYQRRSKNTKGLMTLTWRITDAVEPKISYIAKAPWDMQNSYRSSRSVYQDYAKRCYGAENADVITEIINENEAFGSNYSECQPTPAFSSSDRSTDIKKAAEQIHVIDRAVAATRDGGNQRRLEKLKARIEAVRAYCKLDQSFPSATREQLTDDFRGFVWNFIRRVDDISSLGNIVSVENRYVKERYLSREAETRFAPPVKAPSRVTAQNGPDSGGQPYVLLISPPTVTVFGQAVDFKAIVSGDSAYEGRSATLHYKPLNGSDWNAVPMERRTKATFGIRLNADAIAAEGMEYYIEGTDGENVGFAPPAAPGLPASFSVVNGDVAPRLTRPRIVGESDGRIFWEPSAGNVHWYRIYRGAAEDFTPGPQSFVAYVYRDSLSFRDVSAGFDGKALCGRYFYKVTAVDINLNESEPSLPAASLLKAEKPIRFADVTPGTGAGGSLCVDSDQNRAVLQNVDFNAGEYTAISLLYSARNWAVLSLWIDAADTAEGGTLIGKQRLGSTGVDVFETAFFPISPVSGTHTLYFVSSGPDVFRCTLRSVAFQKEKNREIVITTDSDTFAADYDRPTLRLFAEGRVNWSVKALDGGETGLAAIDQAGRLTCLGDGFVRVVAEAIESGAVGERMVTLTHTVKTREIRPFTGFCMNAALLGMDEELEIGGLEYGYQYAYRFREVNAPEGGITEFSDALSYRIPRAMLQADHSYEITVYAKDKDGSLKESAKTVTVSGAGVISLHAKALFGLEHERGECGTEETRGFYDISEKGLALRSLPENKLTAMCLTLENVDAEKTPFLLIKAETLCGDWTIRVNGIPIVGPKQNDLAVRKDLRIFGLSKNEPVEITFYALEETAGRYAEVLFKTLQFLPEHL